MFNPKHQTLEQFLSRVKTRYSNSSGLDSVRISTWLMNRIDSGDFTEIQVRNSWGQTMQEWAQTRATMITNRQALRAVQSARGN